MAATVVDRVQGIDSVAAVSGTGMICVAVTLEKVNKIAHSHPHNFVRLIAVFLPFVALFTYVSTMFFSTS